MGGITGALTTSSVFFSSAGALVNSGDESSSLFPSFLGSVVSAGGLAATSASKPELS